MKNNYNHRQPNYLFSRTAIEREQKPFIKIAFAVHLSAVISAERYRSDSGALKSAVPHQKPYILVQFLIISFAYAKLIRLKSPPSVAERNCKNKIEQSACQSCLRKKLSLSEIPTDRTFENRHVGCKEREKINRRRTLCTLRINFFEVTPQTACIFSKEILPVKSSLNPYRTYLV